MLRLIFVSVIIVIGGLASLRGPFEALLFYLWYAYFRPEQWIHSFALYPLHISFIAGAWLLLCSIFALRHFRWSNQLLLILLVFLQSTVSMLASEDQTWSFGFWLEFLKVIAVTVLMTMVVTDQRRYRITLLVIGYSLAFEAAKQGWAQFVFNPGAANNNEHPVLGDNNGVAMGMMMLIPIFSALSQTATAQWERWLHRFFLVGLLYRGLSTYSRGGFLAAAAMGVVMLWRSPKRLRMLVAAVVVTLAVTSVLPDAFWDRMRTITVDLEAQDGSARGRFHFWEVAGYMAAANPLTGVGLNGFSRSFSDYDPSHGAYGSYRAVHSAWFGMLADLGYPGLILFLAVIWSAFRSCRRALAAGRGDPAKRDLTVYATSMQASLVAYIVGATFVGGQYSEMFWHLIGLTVVLRNLAVQPVEGDARVAGAQPLPARAPRLRAAAR